MPNYQSRQYANSPLAFPGAHPGNMIGFHWDVPITGTVANLDTFEFGIVPKGFRLMGATLESADLDTNGSPTVTINIGDSGSGSRIFAASTVGQAGTLSSAIATTGHGFLYTSDTLITGSIPTGPATGAVAPGSVILTLWGRFEGSSS